MVETRTLPIGPEELTRYPAARAPIIGVLMAYINTKKRSNLALRLERHSKREDTSATRLFIFGVRGVGISVHGQKRWLNIVMAPLPPFFSPCFSFSGRFVLLTVPKTYATMLFGQAHVSYGIPYSLPHNTKCASQCLSGQEFVSGQRTCIPLCGPYSWAQCEPSEMLLSAVWQRITRISIKLALWLL